MFATGWGAAPAADWPYVMPMRSELNIRIRVYALVLLSGLVYFGMAMALTATGCWVAGHFVFQSVFARQASLVALWVLSLALAFLVFKRILPFIGRVVGITPHCNGPAGQSGPCDSNAAQRPAGR